MSDESSSNIPATVCEIETHAEITVSPDSECIENHKLRKKELEISKLEEIKVQKNLGKVKETEKDEVSSSHEIKKTKEYHEISKNDKGDEHANEEQQYLDEECDSTESPESKIKDGTNSPKSFLETLDLEVPSSYEVEPVDFPKSPWVSIQKDLQQFPLSDEDEDKSIYQAQLLSNCQDVKLLKDETSSSGMKKKVIPVGHDIFIDSCCDESSLDGSQTSLDEPDFEAYLDSPDELDDSIMERLGNEKVEPIPELSAAQERSESLNWKHCVIAGIERRIDLKVLEPYKKVISHAGYLSQGSHNAIIVFSACYLPDRSRSDYDYVMNNLFMYVITTLDQLVTDDYILVYLHGATSRSCMPKFKWLKMCYQMIDRKLRKNLKALYLVHPTFWLKTLVLMTKPFISSKFSRKLFFVYSLKELYKTVPLEQEFIPERVKKYDTLKECLEKNY